MVVCRDPGSIPENWSPNMIEESVEAGNSIALSDNDAPGVVASVWYPIERGGQDLRYCNRCQTHKPPRCHHCSICKSVILGLFCHILHFLFMFIISYVPEIFISLYPSG